MTDPGDPRTPSASASVLTQWMGVTEANILGNVHGGSIMRLCDEVAALAAVRHCGRWVVTVGLDRMQFREPVYVGNLVTVRSTVNAVWRSSMEVGVRVEAEDLAERRTAHTSTAYITFVALDDDRRPTVAPPLRLETPDEIRRERAAQVRRELRLRELEEIEAGAG